MRPRIFVCIAFSAVSILCHTQNTLKISINDIYGNYHFYPDGVEGIRSMADGKNYTVLETGSSIVQYDYETGRKRIVLADPEHLPSAIQSIDGYQFSYNEKKILLTTGTSTIYRHSFEAGYWIYDIQTRTATPLMNEGKQQLATFSPDGLKIAFVKDNNLYYKDLVTGNTVQITSDGERNHVINGAPDWVYEEEFGFSQAYCWSPDSRNIAYYRFDETPVKEFDMVVYNNLYPEVRRFKYPKAGEANSIVTIHVFHTESGKTTLMPAGEETDQYIPRIKWTASPGKLCIIKLNRLQNAVDVLIADALTGASQKIYHEENPKYISRVDDHYIYFTRNQQYFIVLSEKTGYYHYFLYTLSGKPVNQITHGNWEVTDFLGIDETSNILYYSSNQSSIINRDTWAVGLDGSNTRKVSTHEGTNTDEFSTTFRYYINQWSDANTPPQYYVCRNNGETIRVLEDNAALKQEMTNYGFARKEFIKIPVSKGLELNAYIIKPVGFDSTKSYPLFMSVYGGPESQDVTNSWDNDLAWQEFLTQHGIIVACIDNRGTDGRGEEFRKSTYKQLGKLETEDQITAAQYLGSKLWIDENHIGIWGWSYGGYMSLLCMTKGADVFHMGIAVAPVTNWRFYDNIYTERFMQRPIDNPKGYDDNSPIHFADRLKGKLLLIHGTADDNVHLQNSVEMAEQLIQNNKQFQQFMYPNKNHSIYGGNTRLHLYTMMSDFILNNL
jgi:dipeptidyl-peptidase 4